MDRSVTPGFSQVAAPAGFLFNRVGDEQLALLFVRADVYLAERVEEVESDETLRRRDATGMRDGGDECLRGRDVRRSAGCAGCAGWESSMEVAVTPLAERW